MDPVKIIFKWAGIVITSAGVGLFGGLYGLEAMTLAVLTLAGFAIWMAIDRAEFEEILIEETAAAVMRAVQDEDAPDAE